MFTFGGHRIASYHGKRMHLQPRSDVILVPHRCTSLVYLRHAGYWVNNNIPISAAVTLNLGMTSDMYESGHQARLNNPFVLKLISVLTSELLSSTSCSVLDERNQVV